MKRTALLLLASCLWMLSGTAQHKVFVNGSKIPVQQLRAINDTYGIAIGDGEYWYDARCGAWGYLQGPTQGFIPAGLRIGGPLKPNASNGRTGVYVNGRQLPSADVRALQRIINVVPGRFWLDDKGNGGYEGRYATFNLKYLARQKGGSSFYRNSYTGIGAGSSGGTSYVIGDGWSVMTN